MDFSFTYEQEILRDSISRFLVQECTCDILKELYNDQAIYPENFLKKLANLGYLDFVHAGKNGSGERCFLDLFILFEEMGKSLLPAPIFTSAILFGMIIKEFGNEEQKRRYLLPVIRGRALMSLALLNHEGDFDFNTPEIEAVTDQEGGYRLNGIRSLVPYANSANAMLLCADVIGTNGGPTLFYIDAKADGITYTPLESLYVGKKYQVQFVDVKVTSDQIIGNIGSGNLCVEKNLSKAIVLQCAEMIGGAWHAWSATDRYVRELKRFGRPLSASQIVQNHCVEMNTLYISARLCAYQAASVVNIGMPSDKEVAIASACCGDAYNRITWIAHRIFGANRIKEDNPIDLNLKHAKDCEILFGDSRHHRTKLADTMGL